ncbi:hypothetical protein XM50_01480 [Sphingomonas sp. Ag1]|nr:hypothetical protein XM50_01480 [Sphingomonas sp. Ag1]
MIDPQFDRYENDGSFTRNLTDQFKAIGLIWSPSDIIRFRDDLTNISPAEFKRAWMSVTSMLLCLN